MSFHLVFIYHYLVLASINRGAGRSYLGFLCPLGSTGFHAGISGGGRRSLLEKNKRSGTEKNRWLATPPVPIKGRGSPTFGEERVVVVVVFFGLVHCLLNNLPSPSSILDIRTLPSRAVSFSYSVHRSFPFPLCGHTYRERLRQREGEYHGK